MSCSSQAPPVAKSVPSSPALLSPSTATPSSAVETPTALRYCPENAHKLKVAPPVPSTHSTSLCAGACSNEAEPVVEVTEQHGSGCRNDKEEQTNPSCCTVVEDVDDVDEDDDGELAPRLALRSS